LRRPHREIEIFSMSVLDMFASALGAFIMVTIILFPSYNQNIDTELSAAIEAVGNKKNELRTLDDNIVEAAKRNARQKILVDEVQEQRRQTSRCQRDLAVCISSLADTFLIVVMQWEDDVNLDLYVTDTSGHRFSWDKSNQTGTQFPDTEAQLSFDIGSGPGIEVWIDPSAKVGEYKIEYRRPSRTGNPVKASGYYIDRTGRHEMPPVTITDSRPVPAGTLVLSAEGKFLLRH
jgi:hypothetical protein